MELLQGLNDEEVDRKPDRPAPVRVAPEQPAVGFGRLVADGKIHAVVPVHVGRMLVDPGQCTHAVRGKELGLVQHSRQETLHAVYAYARLCWVSCSAMRMRFKAYVASQLEPSD